MSMIHHTSSHAAPRRRQLALVLAVPLMLASLAGCRNDMHDQPRYNTFEQNLFFADSQSARLPVENTVARGNLREDTEFYTGKRADAGTIPAPAPATGGDTAAGATTGTSADAATAAAMAGYVQSLPMPVSEHLLRRGQERFNIYCSPCHGRTGMGNGMIVQRGMKQPPSLHEQRLRSAPPGYYFDVITNGFGVMYSYASRVKPEDRWAIAAYIRALQLSFDAPAEAFTAEIQNSTESTDESTHQ